MKIPFLSLSQSLLLLRIAVAGIFLAHAIVRVTGGTVQRFAGFMEDKGFPFGLVIVWFITGYEIAGGILLALGKFTKVLSAGFILLLLTGIVVIHAANGWFVGEHGSGGIEYSFVLIIALMVIGAGSGNKNEMYKKLP